METAEIFVEFEKILQEHPEKYNGWIFFADLLMNFFLHEVKNHCFTAEDIVHELITKIIEGKRKWNREKYPALDIYMKMCIKSDILNLYNKNKRRKTDCSYEFENSDDEENADNSFFDSIESNTYADPLKEYTEKERIEMINKKLEDDEECWCVFDEMLKGNKNQEIAIILGLSVNEVVNIKKRIIRKIRNN